MRPRALKTLVNRGLYGPDPSLIAEAMLRRRGVRRLLDLESPGMRRRAPADHESPTAPLSGRP
jgi:hypothetical protein